MENIIIFVVNNNYSIKLGVLKVKHKMDAKVENFVTAIPSFAGSLDFLFIKLGHQKIL